MKKDQTLSFKVTEELKRKLETRAKQEGRSLSNFVQQILSKEVRKSKKRWFLRISLAFSVGKSIWSEWIPHKKYQYNPIRLER